MKKFFKGLLIFFGLFWFVGVLVGSFNAYWGDPLIFMSLILSLWGLLPLLLLKKVREKLKLSKVKIPPAIVRQATTPTVPCPNPIQAVILPSNFRLHPDLNGLIWFCDGPFANYKYKPDTYFYKGFHFEFSSNIDEEPSVISVQDPIRRPLNPSTVERPPYYPSYSSISPQQRWMYLKLLSNPYDASNDIGYVFILYYGLERHLITGDYERAFNVTLKLRDVYANKSFQSYSSVALIMCSIFQNRPDLLQKFLVSIDNEYEKQIPLDVFLIAKASFDIAVAPEDLMRYSRKFNFTNMRYIKGYPDLFLKHLNSAFQDLFPGSAFFIQKYYFGLLPKQRITFLCNYSLIQAVEIPNLLLNPEFAMTCFNLLNTAHQGVKNELTQMRKQANTLS